MAESTRLIVNRGGGEVAETEKVKFFMFLRVETATLHLVRRARAPNRRMDGGYCLTIL